MKKVLVLFLFILVFPIFADDFTLDEWLSLYKEGFFGEVEEPPAEFLLYPMDRLGLRLIINEEETVKEEEPVLSAGNDTPGFISSLQLVIKEDEKTSSVEKSSAVVVPGLRLVTEEEAVAPAEDDLVVEEEQLLAETDSNYDDLFDEDLFFFEGPPLIFEVPAFEMRSFDDIFPSLTRRQRSSALGRYGLRYYYTNDESPRIVPSPESGIDITESVMKRNPSHIIEAIALVPYMEKEFDLLDIYNALGRISNIKDYPVPYYQSDYYVFSESNRIESNRRRRAIPDPAPATTLPFSETIYLKLNEVTIGNVFLRGDVSVSAYGITYNMTNFADVRYFLVPVMRAERFSTILYLEPIKEGVLIYCTVGFYIPNFVADRVNLTPNINRRLDVFVSWITDGLRRQENAAARQQD